MNYWKYKFSQLKAKLPDKRQVFITFGLFGSCIGITSLSSLIFYNFYSNIEMALVGFMIGLFSWYIIAYCTLDYLEFRQTNSGGN